MAAVSWLNKAWVEAEATSTHGWRLMGVVLGPRGGPTHRIGRVVRLGAAGAPDADYRAYLAFKGPASRRRQPSPGSRALREKAAE